LEVGAKSCVAIPLSIGPASLQGERNVFSPRAAQEFTSRMIEIIFIHQRSSLAALFDHAKLGSFSLLKV
jgi:hypothetical protein